MYMDKWTRGIIKIVLILPVGFLCILLIPLLSFTHDILMFTALICYALLIRIFVDKILNKEKKEKKIISQQEQRDQ